MTYLARDARNRLFFPRRLSPLQAVMAAFFAVILAGTALLLLPISQRPGIDVGWFDALFTAVSATCLVGLTTLDLTATWSFFGLVVILCMIQLGAIGYMSAVMLIALLLGVRMGMPRNLAMTEAGGVIGARDMLRVLRSVALITLAIEGFGALLLALRFLITHHQPWEQSLLHGVFSGVAAFCNAGFMLAPQVTLARADGWLLFMISTLIILGGLGIGVLIETGVWLRRRTLSLHTRLALLMTALLLVLGALLFYLFEARNPDTLGRLAGTGPQLLSSWCMSASARSAGFSTVDLSALSPPTLFILGLLAIVGASPGGTGGGVKTTTIAIIVLAIVALVRRRMDIELFRRRISGDMLRLALSLVSFYLLLWLSLVIAISLIEINPRMHAMAATQHFGGLLFEIISAFGAVGWNTGLTPTLQPAARVLIILSMFIGRLGALGFVYLFARSQHAQLRRLPVETVMAG